MVGNRRRAQRYQPAQMDQGVDLGVQPGSFVVAEVDAQHGLDAALVMQRQPTQGFLVCRGDHPLRAAAGDSNRCVAAGEHDQQVRDIIPTGRKGHSSNSVSKPRSRAPWIAWLRDATPTLQ